MLCWTKREYCSSSCHIANKFMSWHYHVYLLWTVHWHAVCWAEVEKCASSFTHLIASPGDLFISSRPSSHCFDHILCKQKVTNIRLWFKILKSSSRDNIWRRCTICAILVWPFLCMEHKRVIKHMEEEKRVELQCITRLRWKSKCWYCIKSGFALHFIMCLSKKKKKG